MWCSLIHLPFSNTSLAFHGTKLFLLLFSHKLCLTLQFQGLQHARLPYSNSCPLSRWCHPTISSSVIPFSSCLQYFPASGSFPMTELFTSGSQSIGASASASILPMNIQGWFPLGLIVAGAVNTPSPSLKHLIFTYMTEQIWHDNHQHMTLFCLTTRIHSYCAWQASSARELAPENAPKSFQSCPTLCDPTDSSPPGSPVPGILQARTLEWVAISFSNAWKWKVKGKSLSRVRPSAAPWTAAFQALPSNGFSRQEYWSGVPLPSPKMPLDND